MDRKPYLPPVAEYIPLALTDIIRTSPFEVETDKEGGFYTPWY